MKFLRKMYDWVIKWAEKPSAEWALFLLAFAEASFFPIPPDVLLISLGVGNPGKSFRYATISLAGSFLGGLAGYYIGWGLFELAGKPIIDFYGLWEDYARMKTMFSEYGFMAVFIAGLSPIPYKVFSISSGAFHFPIIWFSIATILSRGARFFLVGAILFKYGQEAQEFIDKHFNKLVWILTGLLAGGFVVLKWVV